MSTTTQTAPEVKPAITEADVVAFLVAKVGELHQKTGVNYAFVSVEIGTPYTGQRPIFGTYVDGGSHLKGASFAEVIDKAVAEVAPDALIARKRAEAERLLAEAAKIEASKAGKEATQ